MALNLAPPDWETLIGGSAETSWIADRYRKLGIALTVSEEIERVFYTLQRSNALFNATSESLLSDRFAAQWYVSLAGFSQKTLQNACEVPSNFGLTQRPSSLVDGFAEFCERQRSGEATLRQMPNRLLNNLPHFAAWINHELSSTLSPNHRTPERALIRVSLLLGGRIIGQGQNEGGNEGVILVKELLYRELCPHCSVEIRLQVTGDWKANPNASEIPNAVQMRFDGRLTCEFISGGNRPDIKILLEDKIIAVGEIKARKDLSNLWESWMPQVTGHMKTWSAEFPQAARLFFGTVITQEMIDGASKLGTQHTGLRELVALNQLTTAYNLSQIVDIGTSSPAGLKGFTQSWLGLFEQFLSVP